MGVLRITAGEGSFLQTLAGRIRSRENPKGFESTIAATGSENDEISDAINNAGEEGMDAGNSAGILARLGPTSRSHQRWRRRQPGISKSQPVARGQDSTDLEEIRSSNVKVSSGQPSQGAIKDEDGPRPPTSPSVATEDPFCGPNENQKDGSNTNGGKQNNNQGQGPSGSQNTGNQGKDFDEAGPPGPSEKMNNQDPGQNGNQGNGFDQSGGPKPNQNAGGQNSGQGQGNNGNNGNQAQDQGKNGKGDQTPKPKQNQNGNQNSDKTSGTHSPKPTSTSDQTTDTVATSSPAVQTTEPQTRPTDPLPPPQPAPLSAQTVQQPSQPPAVTPSVQTSTASVGPSTATSLPPSTLPSSSETQVPAIVPPTPTGIAQPVAALDPTTSQVPESAVTQGSSQSAAPSSTLDSRQTIGIAVGGISAVVLIAALVVLFLKLRRRGASPFHKQSWYRVRDMTQDVDREKRLSGALTGESLVSQAAPVAGLLHDQEAIPHPTERDGDTSLYEVQQPRSVAQRLSRFKSLINNKGQELPGRLDQEDQNRMSTASNPFYLQDELQPAAPNTRKSVLPVAQADLVQQTQPAESKDCPFQRLQGKLRLHNSSDPRPPKHFSKATAVSRESVSTMSSSGTYPSPHTSARFSFGLLLQPSLDLFKFSDIRSSLGGRGSGWSLWFKKDDASSGKTSDHPEMGTK